MDGTGATKALRKKRLPLATSGQHVDDGLKHLPHRSRPHGIKLAHVTLARRRRAPRKQRLHSLPDLIWHEPQAQHSLRLGSIGHQSTDKLSLGRIDRAECSSLRRRAPN